LTPDNCTSSETVGYSSHLCHVIDIDGESEFASRELCGYLCNSNPLTHYSELISCDFLSSIELRKTANASTRRFWS